MQYVSFDIDWYKTVKRHFQDNWGKQQRLGMIKELLCYM